MYIGGWTFHPTENNTTIVKNYAINNLKGMIPKIVITAAAAPHANIFINLRNKLSKMESDGQLPSKQDFVDRYKESNNFMHDYENLNQIIQNKALQKCE